MNKFAAHSLKAAAMVAMAGGAVVGGVGHTSAGAPSATVRPRSSKRTRSAYCAANVRSCSDVITTRFRSRRNSSIDSASCCRIPDASCPDSIRDSIEWVRTVVHEWGHLTLPAARGFTAPENDAAGYLVPREQKGVAHRAHHVRQEQEHDRRGARQY